MWLWGGAWIKSKWSIVSGQWKNRLQFQMYSRQFTKWSILLKEEVIEELNGAVVLNSSVAAIPIADFRHTVFLLGVHGQLEHPWASSWRWGCPSSPVAAPLHRQGQLVGEGGHCHRTHRTPHWAVRLLHGLLHEADKQGYNICHTYRKPTWKHLPPDPRWRWQSGSHLVSRPRDTAGRLRRSLSNSCLTV